MVKHIYVGVIFKKNKNKKNQQQQQSVKYFLIDLSRFSIWKLFPIVLYILCVWTINHLLMVFEK